MSSLLDVLGTSNRDILRRILIELDLLLVLDRFLLRQHNFFVVLLKENKKSLEGQDMMQQA